MADSGEIYKVRVGNDEKSYFPPRAGMSRKEIDADLATVGASRIKGWGEWAKDEFIPNTPVGWGILAGSLPLGEAGLFAKLGWTGGKLALAEAPAMARYGRMAWRIGKQVAGGAAGAEVSQMTNPAGEGESITAGALKGFMSGLVGEGSTVLLNSASRLFSERTIRTIRDPQALSEYMNSIKAGIVSDPTPQGIFKVVSQHEFARAADSMMRTDLDKATTQAVVPKVFLKNLAAYLKSAGVEAPEDGVFLVRDAMDGISRIGPEIWKQIGKTSPTKRVLQDLRESTISDFGRQVGKDAAATFGSSQETYGMWMEMDRLLGTKATDIFHDGGVDFSNLQKRIMNRYSDPKTGKWFQDRLGDKYDELVDTAFRGSSPPTQDVPSKYYLRLHPSTSTGLSPSIGEQSAGGKFLPQYAGRPYQVPGGTLNPVAAYGMATAGGGQIPSSLPNDALQAIPNPFGATRPGQ